MRKVAFLMLFISLPLMAADNQITVPGYTKIHEPYGTKACEKQETNRNMALCSQRVLASSKKALDTRYQFVLKTLKIDYPATAKKLQSTQKMWEAFYPINCEVGEHESESGTGYSSILDFCLIQMVNERISYLDTLID